MSVTVETSDGTLGRVISGRRDNKLVACAVEHDDGWWDICIPDMDTCLRADSRQDALAWVTHLTTQESGPGDVVAVHGDDLHKLLGLFALYGDSNQPAVLRIWIDPLDAAVKFKTGNGMWTRPYGQIEVTE